MNLAILKTTILSIIFMGVVILLAGIALLCWKNQIAPHMRYLLPIPPIGVASYVFVYNMFSKYGGTRPGPFGDIIKEIVWASAISSVAFFVFTLILVFMVEKMNSKERFINALERKEVDRIPYGHLWFGAGNAVLERMGKSLKDVYYSAEGIARAQILAREMYHHDNVMSPWGCLLVEAEALGTKAKIKENGYPTVDEYALKSVEEHEKLDLEAIRRSERVKTIRKSIEILKREIGDEAFISGATLSPLMLAFQVLEGSRLCIDLLKAPEAVHELLEKLTESCILFADSMLEAGADGIFVENGESTADLFSPQMAEEFILPYTKKLYDHIKENGGYVISHNCAILAFHDLGMKLEPHALNFAFGDVRLLGKKYGVECTKHHNHNNTGCGPRHCFKEFKAFSEAGICLMGNIIPDAPLTGSAAKIEHEVKSCLEAAPEKGFILSTGCEIPLNTPLEKMELLRDVIKAGL